MGCGASKQEQTNDGKKAAEPAPAAAAPPPAASNPPHAQPAAVQSHPHLGSAHLGTPPPIPYAQPTKISTTAAQFGPCVVNFLNVWYVYYVDGSNNMQGLYSSTNVSQWQAASGFTDGNIIESPAAIVTSGFLWLFYVRSDNSIWYRTTADGATWNAAVQVTTSIGPLNTSLSALAPVSDDNYIYVFSQGSYDYASVLTWRKGTVGSGSPPSVTWVDDHLAGKRMNMSGSPAAIRVLNSNDKYVFHQGYNSDQTLWKCYSTSNDTWPDTQMPGNCYGNPGACVRANGDRVVIRMDGGAHPWVLTNEVSNVIVPGVGGVSCGMAAFEANTVLCAVYRNASDGQVYVLNCDASTSPPPIGHPLQMRSNANDPNTSFGTIDGPCSVVFNGIIFVFFVDGANNCKYVTTADAITWSAASTVPGTQGGVYGSPGALVDTWNGVTRMYVFYQSANHNWSFLTTTDALTWSGVTVVGASNSVYTALRAVPRSTDETDGFIYVFWADSGGYIYYSISNNGTTFGGRYNSNVEISAYPCPVRWDNQIPSLYVFFQTPAGDGRLNSIFRDSSNVWRGGGPYQIGMQGYPGVVSYGMYNYQVFHLSADGNGLLYGVKNVGNQGSGPDTNVPNVQGVTSGPTGVYWRNMVWVFYRRNDGTLYYVQAQP